MKVSPRRTKQQCLIYFSACHRNEKDKKYFNDATTNRIPDVELANLRDAPRRGNFVHSNNILYNSGPLTDSEIALLPQIRRDQVSDWYFGVFS
jgi:proto-oncogene tyrosine-protein kinase ROS